MRVAALLLIFAAAAPAPTAVTPQPEFVQAVEFPYYLYPRALWERELVWLKTIGVRTVEFSVPWNWHRLPGGEFDFTGQTSPRRNLVGLVRILRKLGLRGWVRPVLPVAGAAGNPVEPREQRAWHKELTAILAPQTERHGGPIAFADGGVLAIDAAVPPHPSTAVSATDQSALSRSREAIARARGAILWTDVEDSLYPAGWEPSPSALLHTGAVGVNGNERSTTALRREAALLRNWGPVLAGLRPVPMPKASPKLPERVTAVQLVSPAASAISIVNDAATAYHSDLRVLEPLSNRVLIIPSVSIPAGESLWLPLNVTLGPRGLCHECSNFSAAEHIIYATAELLSIEYENGILAMEFVAPEPGEVILQLAREPVGPLLAAGKPTEFDWDEKTLRARLPVPAGKGDDHRVRIGLAMEAPETSAFFSDARRLIIGRKNLISTTYSSADVASRSRLRVPEGFTATPSVKSPNEIAYSIAVPADALHGDWVPLALEADAMMLGRARVQLLRPASVRLTQALGLHFGSETRLDVDPPTAPAETRGSSNLEIVIRNNSPEIQTYRLEAMGDGVQFLPARAEISIGAADERAVSFRLFGDEGTSGLRDWHLHVTGAADLDLPMRVVFVPRTGAVAWTADLDGDGSPEWVLESQRVRAVFSARDARWIEFVWKDTDTNFLPESGVFAQTAATEIHASGGVLTFAGNGWTRTVRLSDAALTIEQTPAVPQDGLISRTSENLSFSVNRQSPSTVVYSVSQVRR